MTTRQITGQLTICDSKALSQLRALAVEAKANQWTSVTLDLSAIDAVDSLLFAGVFELQRALNALPCTLRIAGLSNKLQTLADAYGIEELLQE